MSEVYSKAPTSTAMEPERPGSGFAGRPGVRNGRPRSDDVEERIRATARELLASSGYGSMSFEAISQATGVSRSTIYRRWQTRGELAADLLGDFPLDEIKFDHGLSARLQIERFIGQIYLWNARPFVIAAVSGLSSEGGPENVKAIELLRRVDNTAREHFSDIFEAMKQAGGIRENINTKAIYDMITGMAFTSINWHRDAFVDDYALIGQITNVICDGILR
jgi:AcrR family transcriptional regulator